MILKFTTTLEDKNIDHDVKHCEAVINFSVELEERKNGIKSIIVFPTKIKLSGTREVATGIIHGSDDEMGYETDDFDEVINLDEWTIETKVDTSEGIFITDMELYYDNKIINLS